MGVIYRDGVAYGGISSIAGNVSYDNSTSHLQSSTVQNAITELKSIIDSEEYTSIAFVNSLPAATNAQYNTLYIVDNNNDGIFELWVIKTALGQKAWVAVGDNSKIAALQESVAALQTEISGLSYIASASIDNATGNLVLTDSDNNTVTLQLDGTPTANSKKPITSGAVYTALDNQVGKKEYVNNTFKGEIFNTYSGSGKNIASGFGSHAEGVRTKASDNYSHAEGFSTTASGESSHAEGFDTEAWGAYSHAEGRATDAHAAYSHVSGWGTRANTAASTVIGTYNVIDGTRSIDPKHLFIVGNGLDDNNRSNILEVSDTYLNVNGDIKQNGVTITSTPHTELTQAQYDALQNPDAGTEFFITDASSGVAVSALESRLAALEMQETVYYINGVQRVPLYSQNITKMVKVDDNTVDWYFLEPTSQKTYKARVTAQGEGNTRTNPLIIVTEVSS